MASLSVVIIRLNCNESCTVLRLKGLGAGEPGSSEVIDRSAGGR
jgi:hypothetical protein